MIEQLLNNQLAAGLSTAAVVAGIVALLAYLARQIPGLIWTHLRRQFTVEVDVLSQDPAFGWLNTWLAAHDYALRATRLRLSTTYDTDDDDTAHWVLSPGLGAHLIWHKGRPLLLTRSEDQEANSRDTKERISITAFGRSQAYVRDLINEAKSSMTGDTRLAIRVWSGYWSRPIHKSARPLDTITLAEGQTERILARLHRFEQSREWYRLRGIAYRISFLFSGPVGTGKTTTIMAIAAALGRPLCVLNLGSVNGDDGLFSAMQSAPRNAIIVLEDIDCAGASKDRAEKPAERALGASSSPAAAEDDKSPMGVTKAGLLNALDGITTPDGRIFMMTTNYPERLDAALLRPGRADVHERLEHLAPSDQRRMAERFFGPYAGDVCPVPTSPAELQGAFMRYPECAAQAFAWLNDRRLREAA